MESEDERVMTAVDPTSSLWLSWLEYKRSQDFETTKHWAQYPMHVQGSLWAAYMRGYGDGAHNEGNCPIMGLILLLVLAVMGGFFAGKYLP